MNDYLHSDLRWNSAHNNKKEQNQALLLVTDNSFHCTFVYDFFNIAALLFQYS